MSSITRELIRGDMHEYKSSTLQNIANAFHKAGRDKRHSIFLAGIGNSHTDGLAYSAAGIPLNSIFIINPAYEILHWSPTPPEGRRKRLGKLAELRRRKKNTLPDDQCKDRYHYLSYEDPVFIGRIRDSLKKVDFGTEDNNTAAATGLLDIDVCEARTDLIDLNDR